MIISTNFHINPIAIVLNAQQIISMCNGFARLHLLGLRLLCRGRGAQLGLGFFFGTLTPSTCFLPTPHVFSLLVWRWIEFCSHDGYYNDIYYPGLIMMMRYRDQLWALHNIQFRRLRKIGRFHSVSISLWNKWSKDSIIPIKIPIKHFLFQA